LKQFVKSLAESDGKFSSTSGLPHRASGYLNRVLWVRSCCFMAQFLNEFGIESDFVLEPLVRAGAAERAADRLESELWLSSSVCNPSTVRVRTQSGKVAFASFLANSAGMSFGRAFARLRRRILLSARLAASVGLRCAHGAAETGMNAGLHIKFALRVVDFLLVLRLDELQHHGVARADRIDPTHS
jgi:hypothetical protein